MFALASVAEAGGSRWHKKHKRPAKIESVLLGPRPYYLFEDMHDSEATTIEEYMDATPSRRTDLYATCGTSLSHAEGIELFKELDVKMTPDLKTPSVAMP